MDSKAARSHWLAPAGLGLAVAGSALPFYRSFDSAFGFPKYLALWLGVWVAAAGAAASRERGVGAAPLDAPLAALLAVMALSLGTAPDRLLGLLGFQNVSFGLWPSAALAALVWLTPRHAAGRETRLVEAALAVYGLIALYAIAQAAGFELFAGMPPLPNGRAYSTLGSPVALGECMALLLPPALHWALEKRRPAGWACLAALLGGLLASTSRGAWLSAAAGCGLLLFWRFRAAPRRRALVLLAAAALVPAFAWRLSGRPLPAGDGGRTLTWRASWELFREKPMLGWGANNYIITSRARKTARHVVLSVKNQITSHSHNDFLHVLATTGVLGLAAYLWLLLALARAALQAARDPARPWAASLACGLLALFLNMKLNPASLSALACAALFAGLLTPARPAAGGRRLPGLLLLAGATASLLLLLRMAAADLAVKSGKDALAAGRLEDVRRRFARAVRLNPWELDYRLAQVNALSALSSRVPPSALNRELLGEAKNAADEAVRRHPGHPDAHYSAGVAELNLAYLELSLTGRLGGLVEARLALDRALALDPTYASSLKARLVVAQAESDGAKITELEARLAELERP